MEVFVCRDMVPASWITSLTCASSATQSPAEWLRFIFLSPCPQRALFSAIDLLFLLLLFAFTVQKLWSRLRFRGNSDSSINEPLLESKRKHLRTTLWFKLSLFLTVLLAISYAVLCVVAFTRNTESEWKTEEGLFLLIQAVTHGAIVILIAHEKRFQAASHPMTLRLYWVANFAAVCLFAASAVIRLSSLQWHYNSTLVNDDAFFIVNIPVSSFLLLVAIRGSTGITTTRETHSVLQPDARVKEPLLLKPNVSCYASASWLSRATWFWMNPLLSKGYKSPLKMEDVPLLAPQHRAERTSEIFQSNWPKPADQSQHPVRTALLRCFWMDLLFTAFLGIVYLGSMFVGPTLIQKFVDFTSGKKSSPYEGYYLITTLIVAKFFEVLCSHQFEFNCLKIGMLIQSSLITSVYKKGLRLSCSARQEHGVGQVVNYMAVDAQQVSNITRDLHNLWLMPLQVAIAFTLLFSNLGVYVVVAFLGLVVVLVFSVFGFNREKHYQLNVMKNRDSRMKAINEVLNYMRVIKFQAWEEHFNKRIQAFREVEYGWLTKFMYFVQGNILVMWSTPVLFTPLTLWAAILMGVQLDAGKVFTLMTFIKILQGPIRTFPQSLINLSQAMISLRRLESYMTSGELVQGVVERMESCSSDVAVEVKDGALAWDDESNEALLRDLNLVIKKGELAAIVGTVGSGKSSLLAAILGEMRKISGMVRVCGTTAYVAQTSWIQNGTIQDNILFGLPMNTKRYRETVRVCCLEKDLEMMEFGDQTEIGERGINLSGGQKQRVQLARAVYQDCDIYILDDVFSAVDAQTGSKLFKECVRGVLKDKTILLVTHQLDFLHNVDLILVMRDGRIVQSGRYEEILESGMDFKALVIAHETSMELVEMSANGSRENSPQTSKSIQDSSNQGEPSGINGSVEQPKSEKGTTTLVRDEERETGQVDWRVYKLYCTQAFGWWGIAAILLTSLAWQASLMASDYWLAFEIKEDNPSSFNPSLFINVYVAIVAVSIVLMLIRSIIVTYVGLKIGQSFFQQILHSLLHAPMSVFDTTPLGRILTRASRDQFTVDFPLPITASVTMTMYITVLGTIIIICQYAWPTIFVIIPLGWLNIWYRSYYLATSRELTRFDSITKAPVIHHFSESIAGVMTVRCFRKQGRFIEENIDKVNANLRMDFHNKGSNEWFGFRLELIGTIFLCISATYMVILPSNIIQPAYVGLTLSYSMSLNGVLFSATLMSCFLENRMISVERLKQFTNIPSEAAWRIKDCLPSPNWPTEGNINLKDLQVRYRPNTPLILKGITLSIQGGEKIGVVGRTGSGKSTLIQAFFRLVEPSGGKIIIDGVDICTLGLHDLRSCFGIIPQDPVLFEGTIRSNVDPVGLYSDEEIWKSLERCQLKEVVAAKPEKLDAPVVDNGDNWSMGQRQLICLGRVILKRSRLLFLDEATASVDSKTDAVMQRIIREDFSASTIISIAHKIPTVMDCDRVLVIDAGRAEEFDKPSRLLERPSLFGALVQEYGNRSSGL